LAKSNLATTTAPQIEAWPHQIEAVGAIVGALGSNSRTHVAMACGTGKTLVCLWAAEAIQAKTVLVLVPSLFLIGQLMKEWLSATKWPQIHALAVCSDNTVTKGLDEIEMKPEDCDFPVSYDPKQIAHFLNNNKPGVKVVFATYHSSFILAEALAESQPFDFGIFDEAHRTAGFKAESYYNLALKDDYIPIQKRLFVTATPRHSAVPAKAGEEGKILYSMDNEELYGKRAYSLSFRRAVELGIICDYKIIVPVVTSKSLKSYLENGFVNIDGKTLDSKSVAMQIALEEVTNNNTIGKIIGFHKTVKNAEEFAQSLNRSKSFNGIALHVNGKLPGLAREKVLDEFRSNGTAMLTNARCLTEGVDVPITDAVAFLSRKSSKIDIIQAIGRAMRKAPNKACGYVIVPIFLDSNQEASLKDLKQQDGYENLLEVLQALQEQDEALALEINLGSGHSDKNSKKKSFLDEHLQISGNSISYQFLKENIKSLIINNLQSEWHSRYGALVEYRKTRGHASPSKASEDLQEKKLGSWVRTQRQSFKNGALSQDRINLLNSIGLSWDFREDGWQLMFEGLKCFSQIHGHANPSAVSKDLKEKKLGQWTSAQRQSLKKGALTQDRVNLLNSIGFLWDPLEENWQSMFEELRCFSQTNGHASPSKASEDLQEKKLGSWVRTQRQSFKNGALSLDRINLLNSIGLSWDLYEDSWQLMFEELKCFSQTNGHASPSAASKDLKEKKLGQWTSVQRHCFKNGDLTQTKVDLLNSAGISWNAFDDSWQLMFERFKHFSQTHGHTNPSRHGKNKGEIKLGKWVSVQRQYFKKGALSADKIELLNSVGIRWVVR